MKPNVIDKYNITFTDSGGLEKAWELYKLLREASKCNNGFLSISREKFIKLAMVIADIDNPYDAYKLVQKMRENGMILQIDKDFVIVNLNYRAS